MGEAQRPLRLGPVAAEPPRHAPPVRWSQALVALVLSSPGRDAGSGFLHPRSPLHPPHPKNDISNDISAAQVRGQSLQDNGLHKGELLRPD